MIRVPPQTSEQLSTEQREVNDIYTELVHRSFGTNGSTFVYEQPNGALMGPFPFFISHPEVGKRLYDLQLAFSKLPLPPDIKEVGILATAAQYIDCFVGYAHEAIAVQTGKISPEQAQILKRGEKPDGLTDECSVAYDIARSLAGRRETLPEELWGRAVEVLGRDTTLALLHYIGFYSYVCVALNGVDAGIPS